MKNIAGQSRTIVQEVTPCVDCGRYPAKRIVGDEAWVEAAAFADGHDLVSAALLWRKRDGDPWTEARMEPLGQDKFRGAFTVRELGQYQYTVSAWVDHFATWLRDLEKRQRAGQDLTVELLHGAELVRTAINRATGADRDRLSWYANELTGDDRAHATAVAFEPELGQLMYRCADRDWATTFAPALRLTVEREKARFGSWYELFPRSFAREPGQHGTLRDVERQLPYIAGMGFDVLYLPPIHPIGRAYRKGRNNAEQAQAGDVGSPWGIGTSEGGHKALHPQLGTLEDFQHLLSAAREHGVEIALDVAFQCSPDHPYVKQHPDWFRRRPDGSIQYAENPPKKYQDIYPFDFETSDWQGLWNELKSVVVFWIEQGVRIFRVDNPHTKPFAFWEWLIGEIKRDHPDALFLSEAFTRPRVMQMLAKAGFTQSYTYFSWRNTKWELTQFVDELRKVDDFLIPNLWPNTPDILPEYLQHGGRAGFMSRFVLAATLGASYGIYGPAFELSESAPREPGSEEYLNSEKYEIRRWDLTRADSLAPIITRVNQIRSENPALQQTRGFEFLPIDNEQLMAFAKYTADKSNVVIVVVNLDPHNVHSGWLEVPLERLGAAGHRSYQVHDLLTGARYLWQGARNFVRLDPHSAPAHIFRLRHWVRTEHDFEYYL